MTEKMSPIVTFKSIPEMWEKENDGRKANTLRKIDPEDDRFIRLRSGRAEFIRVVNTETGDALAREISDYSEWEGWAIISWRHPPKRGENEKEVVLL